MENWKKKKRNEGEKIFFSCSQLIGTFDISVSVLPVIFLCTRFGMYVFSAYIKFVSIFIINVCVFLEYPE